MPKRKIAIAMSEKVLADLDKWATGAGVSRSAIIQEATAEYVARVRTHAHDEAYQRRAAAAIEDMRAFAKENAASDQAGPSSLEILRELRRASEGSEHS